MGKNNTFLVFGTIALCASFLLGYSYAYREYIIQNQTSENSIQYIDISTSTRNITIKNAPENIRFRVNDDLIYTGSIDLK